MHGNIVYLLRNIFRTPAFQFLQSKYTVKPQAELHFLLFLHQFFMLTVN